MLLLVVVELLLPRRFLFISAVARKSSGMGCAVATGRRGGRCRSFLRPKDLAAVLAHSAPRVGETSPYCTAHHHQRQNKVERARGRCNAPIQIYKVDEGY